MENERMRGLFERAISERGHDGELTGRLVAGWLRRNSGVVVDGLRIAKGGHDRTRATRWGVKKASGR